MDAQGYQRYDDRYGAYERPGYGDDLPPGRGGARGRGPAAYGRDDEYASREEWATPGGGRGAPYPSYQDDPYDQGGRDDGFESSMEIWQPVGVSGRAGGSASQSRSRRGGAAQPVKRRKGGGLRTVFGLLLILALVAVLGVEFGPKVYHKLLARGGGVTSPQTSAVACATETTPSAQTKPPTGSTAFATTAYTLTYPSSWQKTSQSGASQSQCDVVYVFSQPNGAAKVNVEQAGAFTPLSDQQVIQAETQSAQQQGSTFTEITSAATTQSIGGEVWQRREYQVSTKGGVKLHLALLAGHHKSAGFAIVLLSSDAGFASDDTTTFEPVLHSFQFV
jgi:hypothetical protein